MRKHTFAQQLRQMFRRFVGSSRYEHNPLLINSLAEFNFRPPILLVFPGEPFRKNGRSFREFSNC